MKNMKQFWFRLKQKTKNKLGEKNTARFKKALKAGRIVKNVICWTLIAVLTVAIIIFMTTKISGGTPSVFGYSIHRIISGSMEPELMIGDVIVGKDVSDPSEINVGDIITFKGDERFENQKVTHRVLVAPYDDGRGNTVIVTKGDANTTDDGEIDFRDVESKCIAKVNFFKDIYDFFFSKWGLLIFIGLLLLIFFDEITNIIKLTVGHAEETDNESFQEIVNRLTREQLEKIEKKKAAESGILDAPNGTTDHDAPERALSKQSAGSPENNKYDFEIFENLDEGEKQEEAAAEKKYKPKQNKKPSGKKSAKDNAKQIKKKSDSSKSKKKQPQNKNNKSKKSNSKNR